MYDWLVWPIIGRDISSIRPVDAMSVRERLYEAGQTLFEQGEAANAMYLILSGSVNTFIDDVHVGTLETGAYFGEKAILNESSRSRKVVAATQVRVLEIEREIAKLLRRQFTSASS
jgi:CRP-like cAMP-binding protein